MLTRQEQIQICKTCENKYLDAKVGLLCGLTKEKPNFNTECLDFKKKDETYKEIAKKYKVETNDEYAGLNETEKQRKKKRDKIIGISFFLIATLAYFGYHFYGKEELFPIYFKNYSKTICITKDLSHHKYGEKSVNYLYKVDNTIYRGSFKIKSFNLFGPEKSYNIHYPDGKYLVIYSDIKPKYHIFFPIKVSNKMELENIDIPFEEIESRFSIYNTSKEIN